MARHLPCSNFRRYCCDTRTRLLRALVDVDGRAGMHRRQLLRVEPVERDQASSAWRFSRTGKQAPPSVSAMEAALAAEAAG